MNKSSESSDAGHTICTICGVNKGEKLAYHFFPKAVEMRRKWVEACKLPSDLIETSCTLRLCQKHFTNEDYIKSKKKKKRLCKTGQQRHRLSLDAVPSQFLDFEEQNDANLPAEVENIAAPLSPATQPSSAPAPLLPPPTASSALPPLSPTSALPPQSPTSALPRPPLTLTPVSTPVAACRSNSKRKRFINFRYPEDIGTPHFRSPRLARKGVDFLKSELQKSKKENILLKRKLKRAIDKISDFKHLVGDLTSKNHISMDLHNHLLNVERLAGSIRRTLVVNFRKKYYK